MRIRPFFIARNCQRPVYGNQIQAFFICKSKRRSKKMTQLFDTVAELLAPFFLTMLMLRERRRLALRRFFGI